MKGKGSDVVWFLMVGLFGIYLAALTYAVFSPIFR